MENRMSDALLIARMTRADFTYASWMQLFESDAEVQAAFMQGTLVSQVDNKKTIQRLQ